MDNISINLNNTQCCARCFSPLEGRPLCSHCAENAISGGLEAGTILQGRYLLGEACAYDGRYYSYYAYDLQLNARMLVREFFPEGGICTRVEKRVLFTSHDAVALGDMKNGMEAFHADVRRMSGMVGVSGVTEVRNLFDENGTSYSVVAIPATAVLLSDHLRKNGGRLPTRQAFAIFEGLLTVLDPLHKMGVIHGDLSPENILVADGKVLLTGFAPDGVSGVDSRTKISTSERNRFAAFEQISRSNRATHLSDIYSLGAVLYHMLTGLYPNNVFDRIDMGDGLMVAPAMQNTADLPPALIPILNKMMEIKQFNRFPDLPAVSAAMNNAKLINLRLKSLDSPKPAAPKKRMNKGLLIGLIVGLLGMIGAAVVAVALVIFLILPKLNSKPAAKPDTEQTESGQTTEGEQQGEEKPNEDTPNEEKPNEEKPNEEKPNEGGLPDLPKPDGEEPEDSEAKPSIGILTDETRWMANVIDPDLYVKSSKACFGNKSISKAKIRFVKVLDTIEDATDDAWDISEKQDGGVLAWIEKNSKGQATLYIAGDGGVSAGDSCANMFYGYEMLQEVTFDGNFHTEQVVTMSGMFRNCEGLESADLSGIATKSVTDFSRMFEGCESLTEADFDEFNTLKGLDFSRMFYGCSSVKKLDLSSFDTAAATTMEKMFYGCKKLSTLKIPHFFASTTTNVSGMFGKCKALKSIDTTSTKILNEFE